MSSPLLRPPDYNQYFFLYLPASESNIDMVLFNEDNAQKEHVIYYIIKGLVGPNIHYSNIEKLALEPVHVFQILQHYVLLWNTTIISDSNPMKHIFIHYIIGEKHSKWTIVS
jgi:hypothetical protein